MEDVICRMASEHLGMPEWAAHATFYLLCTLGTIFGGQKAYQGAWRLLGGKPDSPAMKAFLESLASPLVRYDRSTRVLTCPGARITFSEDVKQGIIRDVAGDGSTQLIDALEPSEWLRAEKLATLRRDQVIERDRKLSNERLAASIRSSAIEGPLEEIPSMPAVVASPIDAAAPEGKSEDAIEAANGRPVCMLPSGQVLTVGNRKGKLYLAVAGKPVMTLDVKRE